MASLDSITKPLPEAGRLARIDDRSLWTSGSSRRNPASYIGEAVYARSRYKTPHMIAQRTRPGAGACDTPSVHKQQVYLGRRVTITRTGQGPRRAARRYPHQCSADHRRSADQPLGLDYLFDPRQVLEERTIG